MKYPLRMCLRYYLPVAILCVLVYSPTFTGEFILDDHPLIERNESIKNTRNPLLFFFHEDGIIDPSPAGQHHTGYYRPLTNITYWVDYRLWGMDPGGFRTTNLLLHIAASLLLFHFLLHFRPNRGACLAAALVFALHPVHSESVAFVASRNNILVTIFSLGCILCFFSDREDRSRGYYSASVLCYAIALGFKEFAVMVLPVLFLYRRLHRGVFSLDLKEAAGYIPFLLITFLYLFARHSITGTYLSPSSDENLLIRLVYAPWVVLLNLKYFLFPHGLHSFIIEYPPELVSIESVTGIAALLLIFATMWIFRRNAALVFAFAGFLLALFPVLNIVKTSAVTLISLRWLYFPSVFLLPPVAALFNRGLVHRRHLTLAVLTVVLVYTGGYGYVLNRYLWHNEGAFFHQEVTHFENEFYLSGLADHLQEQGLYERAKEYYIRALERYPSDADARAGYAKLLVSLGRLDDAAGELREAEGFLKTPIQKARWFNNMGTVHFMKREYPEALEYFRRAAAIAGGEPLFRANKGSALGAMGRYDEAIQVFEKGLEMRPGSEVLLKPLELARRRAERKTEPAVTTEEMPDDGKR